MSIYVPAGDTKIYMTFASKAPHKTRFLTISFMEDNAPTDLFADLQTVAWVKDAGGLVPMFELPAINGRKEVDLFAKGSEIFGFWTDAERKFHMAACRKVLRKYGFKGVPHHKLTLADMM